MPDNDLDEQYGDARKARAIPGIPTGIKPWERDNNGQMRKPDSLGTLSEDHIDTLIRQANTLKHDQWVILWLVDESGKIRLAFEETLDGLPLKMGDKHQALGHPTLVDGEAARIGGELWFEDGNWYLSNKSGRYGFDRGDEDDVAAILNNVAADFADAGLSVEIKVY